MQKLEYGTYYHIYNRGNNKTDIFKDKDDYLCFLYLIQKYISLVANIYCYALMRNHFHFLVEVKEIDEIDFLMEGYSNEPSKKWKTIHLNEKDIDSFDKKMLKKPVPSRQFSHLFNSYTKWFNKRHARTGSLFEKNFKRKEITSEEYLKHLVYYIHHNPLHHGFVNSFINYPWTSYLIYTESKSTFLDKETVVEWFHDVDDFISFHQEEHDLSMIEDCMID